jgi:CheY-like chemotaxis protein
MARILLIEDDALLRGTLTQMLAHDGHQVTEATDGEQGLQRFDAARTELVITDILMPGMDGTQVIVALRQRRADLPVIAISGGRRVLSSQFNLETATLVGATCLLAKPFDRVALQSAVRQALAHTGH